LSEELLKSLVIYIGNYSCGMAIHYELRDLIEEKGWEVQETMQN